MLDRSTTRAEARPGLGIADRYRALTADHRRLDEKLAAEMARPLPCSAAMQRIKRRKHAAKDEMAMIERLLDAIGTGGARTRPELRP